MQRVNILSRILENLFLFIIFLNFLELPTDSVDNSVINLFRSHVKAMPVMISRISSRNKHMQKYTINQYVK